MSWNSCSYKVTALDTQCRRYLVSTSGRLAMVLDLLLVYPLRQHRRHAPWLSSFGSVSLRSIGRRGRAWSSNAGRRESLQGALRSLRGCGHGLPAGGLGLLPCASIRSGSLLVVQGKIVWGAAAAPPVGRVATEGRSAGGLPPSGAGGWIRSSSDASGGTGCEPRGDGGGVRVQQRIQMRRGVPRGIPALGDGDEPGLF